MAKIFYVTEKTPDHITAHFFKTEKEALAYGISEWSDFDMFGDPDSEDDSYDKDNDVWFEGDWINTPSGILFSFEEGRAYLQSSDDEEARKYVKKEVGSDGAAIFFDKFKKGMYGYLGNGADGKGFKWEWDGDEINESLVTEKFNFSKKEVEKAATLIASAISQADMVKAKVHDLEYDKGRGAGFEISIDGDKYAGGSYVVKDNGDVVNAAIGNSHPNAVYNTIGNKDIADVFINMEKYEANSVTEANGQTVKEFGDLLALLLDEDSGVDIERAINAMPPKNARVLEKQISTLYKKLFDLTNDGFNLREDNSTVNDATFTSEAEEVTTTRKTVLMFEEFLLEGDCKCGGNCGCTTTTTNEANADGTISDDEDDEMENFFADVEFQVDELCTYIKRETEKIGGPFRSPGYEAQGVKLIKSTFKKHKIKI
tara:strand:+ start:2665 stop:3948 length:1284 start_codon:yes stop_codon:yes gene_type:complete